MKAHMNNIDDEVGQRESAVLEKNVGGMSITYRSSEALLAGILDPVTAALDSVILCLHCIQTSACVSQASSTLGSGGELRSAGTG